MIRILRFFIFIFFSQNMVAQNISYYTNENDSFADVTTIEGLAGLVELRIMGML